MIDRICLTCDCYDPDYECTMSGLDRSYACPLCSDVTCQIEKTDDIQDYFNNRGVSVDETVI